ncbi:MAG: flagellin [Bacillota bacterium]
MRINTNISALNAWKNLAVTGGLMSKSLEKLSSGYRINKAADDAAGLAISEKMRSQTRGLNQAARNAQDGISLIQTAEGALNETHSILQRMRELMVQAGNGTNTEEDRMKIQEEINELVKEIDGISDRTEFNGMKLLNGTLGATITADSNVDGSATSLLSIVDTSGAWVGTDYTVTVNASDATITLTQGGLSQTVDVGTTLTLAEGTTIEFDKFGITFAVTDDGDEGTTTKDLSGLSSNNTFDVVEGDVKLQIGANSGAGQSLGFRIQSMSSEKLGIQDVDVTDIASFDANLAAIDKAISTVSSQRSTLGAYQNRLEHTINNLQTAHENLTAAESRIRDVDMALEMANFTRHQILQQAGTAMLAQANVQTQSVLKLLG